MNGKIVIPVSVIITIVIVVFSLTQIETIEKETPSQIETIEKETPSQIETIEKETPSQIEETNKIDSMLQQIKENKIKNENSKNPYIPKEREWITSGPFKIDRSEYLLGEKIFVNIDQLNIDDKGKVIVFRPINSTHHVTYHTMPFDGSDQRNNYYFTPDLAVYGGICSVDEIIGNWKVVFQGTEYSDLQFKVTAEIIPGDEDRYESVC
jgi:hypothetical protein